VVAGQSEFEAVYFLEGVLEHYLVVFGEGGVRVGFEDKVPSIGIWPRPVM
jgi:hypothetical protein